MKKYLIPGLIVAGLLAVLGGVVYYYKHLERAGEVTEGITLDDKVRSDDTIIVGVNTKSPPLKFYNTKSELIGLDMDFLDAAFKVMGKKYELRPMAWSEKDDLLNNKEIDLIWGGVSITKKRREIYLMTKPYMATSILCVTASGSDIYSLADLEGKRVAHQRGSFVKGLLENYSKNNPRGEMATIEGYPSSSNAMTSILEGKLDASCSSRASLLYYAANSKGKFRVLSEPLTELEGLSVAGRLGEAKLIGEVNNAIDTLKSSGEMSKIERKWFGE